MGGGEDEGGGGWGWWRRQPGAELECVRAHVSPLALRPGPAPHARTAAPQVAGHPLSTTIELCSSYNDRVAEPGSACPSTLKTNTNWDVYTLRSTSTSPPPEVELEPKCGEWVVGGGSGTCTLPFTGRSRTPPSPPNLLPWPGPAAASFAKAFVALPQEAHNCTHTCALVGLAPVSSGVPGASLCSRVVRDDHPLYPAGTVLYGEP